MVAHMFVEIGHCGENNYSVVRNGVASGSAFLVTGPTKAINGVGRRKMRVDFVADSCCTKNEPW